MKVCLTKWISWQKYRDSVYVFHETSKKVYLFSGSAADFWMTAVSCGDREQMLRQLCQQYDSDLEEVIAGDLAAFLDELVQYGLVQEVM